MLSDVEGGEGKYVIVERKSDASHQTYAQALRFGDGSYVVEFRDGSADKHYSTDALDMRTAHKLLTGWVFELPSWGAGAPWKCIRV